MPTATKKTVQRPTKTTRAAAAPAAKKPAPQRAARKAAKAPAKAQPVKPEKPAAAPRVPKAKRVALVRDGFTMPASDFALIATLKTRALAAQREAKKSELLRAGLQALAQLDGDALVQALNRLEPVKTGRPKKAH